MSAQSWNLRRRVTKSTRKFDAKDVLVFVHKIDEIQSLEPRGGSHSNECKAYWDVIFRRLSYSGDDLLVNLLNITPQSIRHSFYYNAEPKSFTADMKEPKQYSWGDTYDIKEMDTERGNLPQFLR